MYSCFVVVEYICFTYTNTSLLLFLNSYSFTFSCTMGGKPKLISLSLSAAMAIIDSSVRLLSELFQGLNAVGLQRHTLCCSAFMTFL